MFTGIIQEVGKIAGIKRAGSGLQISIHAPQCWVELNVDDSVAINGVCQTVVAKGDRSFTVEAVEETLSKTTLGQLRESSSVNLELAMKLDDRLGGHLVLGHVDGVGSVLSVERRERSWLIGVRVPEEFLRYVIPVGSIAIDGVSLTVARLHGQVVTVSIIPHTYDNTTFNLLREGMNVNLEFDLIGKYIERLMNTTGPTKTITPEKLSSWGYNPA